MSKYAHYSEPDPEFAAISPLVEAGVRQLFSLPLDQLKVAFGGPESPLPDDLPTDDEIKTEDREVQVRDGTKIGIRIYKSKDVKPGAPLFYVMHGGGWTIGVHGAEEIMNRYVAVRNGAVVVSVDYRMAPEFRFPYAAHDSFDVLKWCKENSDQLGVDPNRIIVAGTSAGGNLALVMALMAREEKMNGIIGQVANCPATCHPNFFPKDKFELNSYEQNKESPTLDKKTMTWFWDNYLPDPKPDPLHSPLLAIDVSGLPPALIQVAGMDPLRDEGIAYADRLKEVGVPVQLEILSGVPHGVGSLPGIQAAKKHNDNIVAFVGKTLSKP